MATIWLCSSNFKVLLFSLSILADISVSSFFSDDIPESQYSSAGRNLLQLKKACPISFEFQNYTIITSQCKGPNYPTGPCCKSFKEFACPFANELNDLTNNCAQTMFSYINVKGNYTGLFSSKCVEGKTGLDCSAFSPPQPANNTSGVRTTHNRYQILVFTTFSLVLLLSMLWKLRSLFLQIKSSSVCTYGPCKVLSCHAVVCLLSYSSVENTRKD